MYWPNKEESVIFGNFTVEHVSDDPESKLLIRRIVKVTNAKEVTRVFLEVYDRSFIVIVYRDLLHLELLHYCNIRTGHPNHVLRTQLILLI